MRFQVATIILPSGHLTNFTCPLARFVHFNFNLNSDLPVVVKFVVVVVVVSVSIAVG